MLAERPIVEGTLSERFNNEKMLVEGLVAENMVNKKMEVDLFLVKLLGVEEL